MEEWLCHCTERGPIAQGRLQAGPRRPAAPQGTLIAARMSVGALGGSACRSSLPSSSRAASASAETPGNPVSVKTPGNRR
jgi:hypothetical protein